MVARDPDEHHRAATPLELLFDLASVIAIAAAAAGLHHAIADAHAWDGIVRFVLAFFAIWWAWMNYTWFASAYDNEDPLFRILSMVIIGGAVTMAAGVGPVFESLDLTVIVIGYVIMRAPLVLLWLRAARADTARRATAMRYAVGVAMAQIFWVALLWLPQLAPPVFFALFGLGVLLELIVPAIAERASNTPWHRHHIIERYGLLTIIVLGEVLLATYMALQGAFDVGIAWPLVNIAAASLVIMAAMWWLYFCDEDHLEGTQLGKALAWGYGHFIVFGAAAAVGAGFAVMVDVATDHAEIGMDTALLSVGIPLALYVFGIWLTRDRQLMPGLSHLVLLAFAGLILLATFLDLGLWPLAALTIFCVVVRNIGARSE